ncbi:hypothetical protein N7495_009977 [Penicillium taxi]|uniref:uncharacterized protein n=1 Tax=Penicillium taxi TaxID=168475 RepID=UPI00254508B7|nr:uncharacterized protein N7495_009977 [Penicillium taxi]KAJ5885467.1 hypothetical protein N7495_009977 [Penicillium taxi]
MALTTALTRPLQLFIRCLQWSSAVIVMGITSYFIHKGPKGQHIIYQEVIACISVVFFLPAFISPFLPKALSKFVLLIDLVFSYLWLTAFIFSAQDYNEFSCGADAPPGIKCSIKYANESFIFLAFIFSFFALFVELSALWNYHRSITPLTDKHDASARQPLDGPVETA